MEDERGTNHAMLPMDELRRDRPRRLIGVPVLVNEPAGAIRKRLEVHVDVGIADFVIRGAITNHQQHRVG